MKKMLFVWLIALMALMPTGCAGEQDFWSTNKLYLVDNFYEPEIWAFVEYAEPPVEVKEVVTEPEILEQIEELKEDVIRFFDEVYNVDVSKRMAEMETPKWFEQTNYDEEIIWYAYWDPRDDKIYIQDGAVQEQEQFKTVFIHECMHFLGFAQDEVRMLCEGMADALAKECVEYLGCTFDDGSTYYFGRTLAIQIFAVDKEMVRKVVSDSKFSIADRINERLSDIPQPYEKVDTDEIAKNLNSCIDSVETNPYLDMYMADFQIMQAQNIVSSYCKTFEPTEAQIEEIRKGYLWSNYEDITITKKGEYYFIIVE